MELKRTQFVEINKKAQMCFQGCPKCSQGSVLGRLLFLIYDSSQKINPINVNFSMSAIISFKKCVDFVADWNNYLCC